MTETMPDVRSVAVGFWVGTGSRDESDDQAGSSHFLEHLLFKGTRTRSAAAIAERLDEVGGDCNAYTTKEYTAFYVRLLAEHADLGLDILSDIMWSPALRPGDVDAERTVILDEIAMHADEPADLAGERWQAALFPSHPLGRDTLGTPATVRSTSADDIRAFFEQHYRPANMVVSAAGQCGHEELAEAIERRFAGTPGGRAPARQAPTEPPCPIVVVRRPTEQAHLVYGARCVSRFDERRWAFAVLNHVLGGGLSSRLFQKIREQRGLAYSVWSERTGYHDAGSLAVGVGTAPEHAGEVLRLIAAELELLADEGVTEQELGIAKGNLRADLLLSCEDSGARMSRIGSSLLLHGEVLTVDQLVARIEGVQADEVRQAAVALRDAPRTLAAVGPFDPGDFDVAGLGLTGTHPG
ncbi:MAG TPA: pitrilysin family protein [Acidimicrobiales bacterium]|nr:pitrilysin family protein [Acidimicrobiales bacterium]